MRKTIFLFFLVGVISPSFAQKKVFSPTLINLKIVHSLDENKRNEELKPNQETNTVLESDNKSKTSKLKEQTKKIQDRLTKLSFIIDAAKLSSEAIKIIDNIKTNEDYVLQEIRNKPALAVLEIDEGITFYKQTELILRYLVGVMLSGVDIAAMDNADRKVITTFIIQELRDLELTSQNMCMIVRQAKMDYELSKHAFSNWVSKDKQIVEDIIRNAKNL